MKREEDLVIVPGDQQTLPRYCFKIVIIGESGTGKSSILSKGNLNQLDNNQPNGIFEFSWKNYVVNGNFCRIQIWDTCGKELYHSVIKNFYKRAFLSYLVFSLDDLNSFLNLSTWLREIRQSDNKNMLVFLIGNKSDSIDRSVSMDQIDAFKQENDISYYIETSTKENRNIDQLFEDTIRKLYYNFVVLSPEDNYQNSKQSTPNIILDRDTHYSSSFQYNKICRFCLC